MTPLWSCTGNGARRGWRERIIEELFSEIPWKSGTAASMGVAMC